MHVVTLFYLELTTDNGKHLIFELKFSRLFISLSVIFNLKIHFLLLLFPICPAIKKFIL